MTVENAYFQTTNSNSNIHQSNQFNTFSDKLTIASLNVCGLKRRLMYTEFTDLVENYDIFCLSETKLLDTDVISCPGFTFFSQPRRQKFFRRSGGTGFLVRDNLVNYVSIIESKSEYIAWLKICKQCLGFEQDIIIATVYIPPQQSRFFSEDEYDIFEQEIVSVRSNYEYIYLLGDFNAQTSTMDDYTTADSFLSEFFNFDQDTIEYMDQKCVLEKFGIQIKRVSKDSKKNNHGFKLIDLCKTHNFSILNGRYGDDKNIGAMTFRGLSVIDYVLTSTKATQFLHKFKISDLDSLYSEGHALLSLDIRTHIPLNHNATRQQPHDGPISRINVTEFECFKNSINQQEIDELKRTLENADSNCTCETINGAIKNICDLFRESADIVKANRKPSHSTRKPTDKPWFGAQCKTARRNYFLAKRINRRLRTENSQQSLIQMSKTYKRVMNMHINKYKKSQQQVLRRMQASESKKYWKFLNSLKSKQKADSPSADTFYDFFKEIYSAENDSAEDEIPLNFNFEHSNEDLNRPFTED